MRSAALLCAFAIPAVSSGLTLEMVTVGDPGNPPDPLNTNQVQDMGSVPYVYQIGKFEVQNSEYAEFLNAMAALEDTYALYNSLMASDPLGGITQTGSGGHDDPFVYTAKENMGNKPVVYVSFYDAVRFVNWLENGQPVGIQGPGTTETGNYTVYTEGTGRYATTGVSARAANATWVMPAENEWYKAAYYDPSPSGPADKYWLYPTRSDSAPTVATASPVGDISNPGPNVANYQNGADWNGQNGNVTTVGSAGAASASYYGTFDQGGNVYEPNEAIYRGMRNHRSGRWNDNSANLQSTYRHFASEPGESNSIGFRVAAMIPEPPCGVALVLVALTLGAKRWRKDNAAKP